MSQWKKRYSISTSYFSLMFADVQAMVATSRMNVSTSAHVKGDWELVKKTGYTRIPPDHVTNFSIMNVKGPIYVNVQRWIDDGHGNARWVQIHESHPIKSDRSIIFKNNDAIVLAKYGTVRQPEDGKPLR